MIRLVFLPPNDIQMIKKTLPSFRSAERKVLFVLEKIDGLSSQASLSPQPERLTFYFTGLPVSAENVRNVPLR
jgi:hypothetical protein